MNQGNLCGWERDYRGHVVTREAENFFYSWLVGNASAARIITELKGEDVGAAFAAELRARPALLRTCSLCGEELQGHYEPGPPVGEGGALRLTTECEADPLTAHLAEFRLNVPSGVMVWANDLRGLFPLEPRQEIGTHIGCRRYSEEYARDGLATGYVGNTCPSIYKRDDTVFVASRGYGRGAANSPVRGLRARFSISTALWWYGACDRDEFRARAQHFHPELTFEEALAEYGARTLRVRPGTYLFRHDVRAAQQHDEEEGGGTTLFTTILYAGPPTPPVPYFNRYLAHNTTPGQAVVAGAREYPDLYGRLPAGGTPTEATYARVADHMLFVLGNGVRWHENGSPLLRVTPEDIARAPTEIPRFTRAYRWYPFATEYTQIAATAGLPTRGRVARRPTAGLNPDYTRLAFSCLECMIKFGIAGAERPVELERARTTHRDAIALYGALRRARPALSYPDFDDWFDTNVAPDPAAYVAGFTHPAQEC